MRPNFLSGLALDRGALLREDEAGLEEEWRREGTRVLTVWRSRHVVIPGEAPQLVFARASELEAHLDHDHPRVLLGRAGDTSYFAVDLSHLDEPIESLGFDRTHAFVNLREIGALLPREEGALLGYANAMLHWHRQHLFCGRCGSRTASSKAGHVRRCENHDCGLEHFPRTDPAVIMFVERGGHCLLGRQSKWPEGVYSTLAGFVEPGESLEEAVAREVCEETSVDVTNVRYHSSQPWPFPGSLMLGFTATATTSGIELEGDELEDARWFSREELRHREGVRLPSRISVARRLIEDWLGS